MNRAFAKMSDLSHMTKCERAGLESVYDSFPSDIVRNYAVARGEHTHHMVSVETADFFCAGSGKTMNDALAELFEKLGDLELACALAA